MAAREVLALNTTTPQILAPQAGDTYSMPRALGVTGDVTATTGNFSLATAGNGVSFAANTPAVGGAVQLLNWYEENIYTATITCSGGGTVTLNATTNKLAYTRIGRLVTVTGRLLVDSVSSPLGIISVNLPFTVANLSGSAAAASGAVTAYNTVSTPVQAFLVTIAEGATSLSVVLGTGTTHGNSAPQMQATTELQFSILYFAA